MPMNFQEFLKQKVEGSRVQERARDRDEWVMALNDLREQVRLWLKASDSDDVLELVPYEVERMEERLGIYDAPALKIRLGIDEVDIVPVGRYAIGPMPAHVYELLPGFKGKDGPAGGRVDITNGERKYLLIRSIPDGSWHAVDDRFVVFPFDRTGLESILQISGHDPVARRRLELVRRREDPRL